MITLWVECIETILTRHCIWTVYFVSCNSTHVEHLLTGSKFSWNSAQRLQALFIKMRDSIFSRTWNFLTSALEGNRISVQEPSGYSVIDCKFRSRQWYGSGLFKLSKCTASDLYGTRNVRISTWPVFKVYGLLTIVRQRNCRLPEMYRYRHIHFWSVQLSTIVWQATCKFCSRGLLGARIKCMESSTGEVGLIVVWPYD